jgi:MinD-like ATPase involved in chromosome partitioning or flagellar assembly
MSSEPEVALVFTADPWVEQLHRHLSDHGGARVRSLVVDAAVALEESYDVLLVSHRSPLLTRAFVADVHARGRRILGVHDLAEPASRGHLLAVGVDALIESDSSVDVFVRALVTLVEARGPAALPSVPTERSGRLVVVGGAPGTGRTEIAVQLARSIGRSAVLVDADDVGPAVAQRLGLALEPNLRTAIDAVEHGAGDLGDAVQHEPRTRLPIVAGVPSPNAWAQVRPSEVLRVVDRLGEEYRTVVADGAGTLQDVGSAPRGRYATAQAIVRESDALVAAGDASPVGFTRLLAWIADARSLAPATPLVVVLNRAPRDAFRRGELFDEAGRSTDAIDVVFLPYDRNVTEAAWAGTPIGRGSFTKAFEAVTERVAAVPRRPTALELGVAS